MKSRDKNDVLLCLYRCDISTDHKNVQHILISKHNYDKIIKFLYLLIPEYYVFTYCSYIRAYIFQLYLINNYYIFNTCIM